MSGPHQIDRRHFFGLAAGAALSGPLQVRVEPALLTDRGFGGMGGRAAGPAIDVAGPPDCTVAAWARRLRGPLAAGLMQGGPLALRYAGGVDGVTGANQFDARVVPDGQNALLFPGSVAMAWLADDGRVRLDPAHMLPLVAMFGPGVLMVQGGLTAGAAWRGAPGPGRKLRLAVGPGPDPALTALLGLDLLGIGAVGVPAWPDPVAVARAGAADAVFLHGPSAALQAPALLADGFRPALSTERHGPAADPALAAPFFLTGVPESRLRRDPLVEAWRATAAASTLCAVLVVPRMTPAAAIGRWRRAAAMAITDDEVDAAAQREALRLAAGSDAAGALAPMEVGGTTQLALRRWMALRVDWRP
jgi:hypothetical protein